MLFNLQKQLSETSKNNLEEERVKKKLELIENSLNQKLDVKGNLAYLVNLLVDKVEVEKVNGDRKHIKLKIYYDFNTPDIDIDVCLNENKFKV